MRSRKREKASPPLRTVKTKRPPRVLTAIGSKGVVSQVVFRDGHLKSAIGYSEDSSTLASSEENTHAGASTSSGKHTPEDGQSSFLLKIRQELQRVYLESMAAPPPQLKLSFPSEKRRLTVENNSSEDHPLSLSSSSSHDHRPRERIDDQSLDIIQFRDNSERHHHHHHHHHINNSNLSFRPQSRELDLFSSPHEEEEGGGGRGGGYHRQGMKGVNSVHSLPVKALITLPMNPMNEHHQPSLAVPSNNSHDRRLTFPVSSYDRGPTIPLTSHQHYHRNLSLVPLTPHNHNRHIGIIPPLISHDRKFTIPLTPHNHNQQSLILPHRSHDRKPPLTPYTSSRAFPPQHTQSHSHSQPYSYSHSHSAVLPHTHNPLRRTLSPLPAFRMSPRE